MDRAIDKKGHLAPGFFINVVLLILAVFLLYLSSDYPDMARAFPREVLLMIFVVTILDIINGFRRKNEAPSEPEKGEVGSGRPLRVLYMVALMFIFYFLLILFGLIPATFLFLLLAGWTLGYRKPARLIISAVIITAFVHLIFKVVMNSLLPEGLIFTMIGG